MLYDSTKSFLQSILQALETVDDAGWDDPTESGKACLYEMHQMSGAQNTPYKNATLAAQNNLVERLNRAIPHVRTMMVAIWHKDQTQALECGKAAFAELNGSRPLVISSGGTEPTIESVRGIKAHSKASAPG